MRVLLIAMPDTADYIDNMLRIPSLSLSSLAGNLPEHEVKILDLVSFKPRLRGILEETLRSFQPQVVGLSAMSFQFDTLLRVARHIRSLYPDLPMVAGGYHVTLMADDDSSARWTEVLGFLVRGEGEMTLRELVDRLQAGSSDFSGILGLSCRKDGRWIHNPARPLLATEEIAMPRRDIRVGSGFRFGKWTMDVVETSRGCPYYCKFCSIMHMYGNTIRKFSMERVVADLKNLRAHNIESVFFSDDNITYDIDHLRNVCQAIIDNDLQNMAYMTQVTAVGLADHPDVVELMAKANFRIVFVGFESMDPSALKGMRKPTSPEKNHRAAALLREHGIAIIAGCVVGYPDDTWQSITRQYRLMKTLKPDSIYAQYLTPYPKTQVREELLAESLITNTDDYRLYDGFTCNIRTRHLSQKALFRCLKSLTLRKIFDPKLIQCNAFRKMFPLSLIISTSAKCVMDNIYHVVFGRQKTQRFDL